MHWQASTRRKVCKETEDFTPQTKQAEEAQSVTQQQPQTRVLLKHIWVGVQQRADVRPQITSP